jgi:predicted acyltransferase (DUF342 family)
MPERTDGDRIIVTGYSSGSHFPREQKSMNFNWEANGNSKDGPFDVKGSVYGRDLRFIGPGTIHGTVLGRGDLTLENHSEGQQRFFGGVCSHGNIVVTGKARAIQDTLNGGVDKADIVIRGPVMAHNVTLENAIIFGRVEADRVHLINCIVMGAVIAKGQLTCTGSTLLYYNAENITFEGPCTMIHAMGDSANAPVFGAYQDGAGELWDPDVRLYAVLRGDGSGAMTNRVWEDSTPVYDAAQLSPSNDWVRVDAWTREPREKDGDIVYENVPTERFFLTIAGRCLNFENIHENITNLYSLLKHALQYDHYAPQTKAEIQAEWETTCTAEELKLIRLVTQPLESE